jgi:1-aminocyclopropane-1-carboxylate deaminase
MKMPMNGNINLLLPSPLQELKDPLFTEKKIKVFLKRDDLIHPSISGNKWRKLKYNLIGLKKDRILTFGGAFSNHIAATAAICYDLKLRSIGIIRGEETESLNDTLRIAKDLGMHLAFISREEYRNKDADEYQKSLMLKYNDPYIIPEGGANAKGLQGCIEMIDEIDLDFDVIVSAVGTGATLAGICLGLNDNQKAIGIVVLKGAEYLEKEISDFINDYDSKNKPSGSIKKFELKHDYHFGGYAKMNQTLIDFMKHFYDQHKIKTDPVYSGKSLFALYDMIRKDQFNPGSKIIYYHCGGLQGIKGMENRYKVKFYSN